MTAKAAGPMASAGLFSPLGPRGILHLARLTTVRALWDQRGQDILRSVSIARDCEFPAFKSLKAVFLPETAERRIILAAAKPPLLAALANKIVVNTAGHLAASCLRLVSDKLMLSRKLARRGAIVIRLLALLACSAVLTGCATQAASHSSDPPGFLMGFLHGLLALPSLIGSFFWDIRVYAFPNGGRWYDAGFVLGAGIFFGVWGRNSFEQPYMLGYQAGVEAANAKRKISN
jgi:hypothetical protein